MLFANSIIQNKPINIFNNGLMKRDFTYIKDIVEATFLCSLKPATSNPNFNSNDPNPSNSFAPHMIFNIGCGHPIELMYFIDVLESALGRKAIKNYLPMQEGDVVNTSADVTLLGDWINYKPVVKIEEGIINFANWYKEYFKTL